MGPPCRCMQLLSLEDDALIFPVTSSYLRFEDIEKKKPKLSSDCHFFQQSLK